MKVLITEKLSPNKMKTPEGYLICKDVVLARTGKQQYMKCELYPECADTTIIDVDRTPEEVFSETALASFENKPLTCEHPYENVNPDNYKKFSVGFVRDVHKGDYKGNEVMLANIVVTDPICIEEIEQGIRTDLSCGYDCDITDGDNPQQVNIRGNHVALCMEGRAGIAHIVDSKVDVIDANYYVYLEGIAGRDLIGTAETLEQAKAIKAEKEKSWRPGYMWSVTISEKRLEEKNYWDSKVKDYAVPYTIWVKTPENIWKPWGGSNNPEIDENRKNDILSNGYVDLVVLKSEVISPEEITDTEEFVPDLFKDDIEWWENRAEEVGQELDVTSPEWEDCDSYQNLIDVAFTEKVLGAVGNVKEYEDLRKYFEIKFPDKVRVAKRLFRGSVSDSKPENYVLYVSHQNKYYAVGKQVSISDRAAVKAFIDEQPEYVGKNIKAMKESEWKLKEDEALPKLSKSDRSFISKWLSKQSKHTEHDVSIEELLKGIETLGFKPVVENVEGWNKTDWGEYGKRYYISLEGYRDQIMISLLTDGPDADWEVREVNGYFTDSKPEKDWAWDTNSGNEEELAIELTKKCKSELDKVRTKEAAQKIYSKYNEQFNQFSNAAIANKYLNALYREIYSPIIAELSKKSFTLDSAIREYALTIKGNEITGKYDDDDDSEVYECTSLRDAIQKAMKRTGLPRESIVVKNINDSFAFLKNPLSELKIELNEPAVKETVKLENGRLEKGQSVWLRKSVVDSRDYVNDEFKVIGFIDDEKFIKTDSFNSMNDSDLVRIKNLSTGKFATVERCMISDSDKEENLYEKYRNVLEELSQALGENDEYEIDEEDLEDYLNKKIEMKKLIDKIKDRISNNNNE